MSADFVSDSNHLATRRATKMINHKITRRALNQALKENEQNAILIDGFEDAFLGFSQRVTECVVAVYSFEKMIIIGMERDGQTFDESLEYVEYNCMQGWIDERTPIVVVNPFHVGYPYPDGDDMP